MSTLLAARGLSLTRGGARILDTVDLEVGAGEAVAIVGPSGAGKSSLARCLLGLIAPSGGRIEIDGRPLNQLTARRRAGYLAWLPQLPSPGEPIAVVEFLAAARFRFDEPWAASRARALEALQACGIGALAEQAVDSLSGGELQRVALAGLMAQDARAFVLDEPSNHLDPRRQRDTYRLLAEQWRAGRALLIITHDVNLLAELVAGTGSPAPRVVGMRAGRVAFERRFGEAAMAEDLSALFGMHYRWVEVGARALLLPVERG